MPETTQPARPLTRLELRAAAARLRLPLYCIDSHTGEPLRLPEALNRALCCPQCGCRLFRTRSGLYSCTAAPHGLLAGTEIVLERARAAARLALATPAGLYRCYERLLERHPPMIAAAGTVGDDVAAAWLVRQLVRLARDVEPPQPQPKEKKRARKTPKYSPPATAAAPAGERDPGQDGAAAEQGGPRCRQAGEGPQPDGPAEHPAGDGGAGGGAASAAGPVKPKRPRKKAPPKPTSRACDSGCGNVIIGDGPRANGLCHECAADPGRMDRRAAQRRALEDGER